MVEIVRRIYEIIHEMYPGIKLDTYGEPESVFVYVRRVNYHPVGSLIKTLLYGEYRAIKDKEMLIEVHFYGDKAEEYEEIEKIEREIRLSEPERDVKLELVSSEVLEYQGIFNKVYRLRAIDQVFEVDRGIVEMSAGRLE